MSQFFKVTSRSKKACLPAGRSKARLATITTDHGVIQTPAFVPVGTKGTIKALPQSFFKDIGIQLSFVNTYHLVTHPGVEVFKKAGGIHNLADYNIPLMSDSGGFQVFSLAKNEKRRAAVRGDEQPLVEKISDNGVKFRSVYDGQLIEFTPEKSMEYQKIIGADMNMAFDECTYYPATHEYTEKAMKRTHEWLKRCISYRMSNHQLQITNQSQISKSQPPTTNYQLPTINQYLYGIIQGGTYEDLRLASAKFIQTQDVSGVAIGGVSVGETKSEMRDQVRWVAPYLPQDKPVHLLGVGQVDDIIDLVKYGIDTFDCVEPTRVARMGSIYQLRSILLQLEDKKEPYEIDIQKSVYKTDVSSLDEDCDCYVCKNYTKAYLHHLFKQREIIGYTLATYHNLWVMERLMEKIREMITENLL